MMNYVYCLDGPAVPPLEKVAEGDSVTILIVADSTVRSASFEKELELQKHRALLLASEVAARKADSKILIEWGTKDEVVASCVAREKAEVLE